MPLHYFVRIQFSQHVKICFFFIIIPAFNLERSLSKPAISKLKKTGEAFLQDGPCTNITPNLMKCRECRMKGNKQSKLNIFCRFYAFRRLRYSQKGNLTIAGFSELDQYEKEDLGPWLPTRIEEDDPNTDLEVSKYIMLMTADKFCELVLQEKDAKGALTCTDGNISVLGILFILLPPPPPPSCFFLIIVIISLLSFRFITGTLMPRLFICLLLLLSLFVCCMNVFMNYIA